MRGTITKGDNSSQELSGVSSEHKQTLCTDALQRSNKQVPERRIDYYFAGRIVNGIAITGEIWLMRGTWEDPYHY